MKTHGGVFLDDCAASGVQDGFDRRRRPSHLLESARFGISSGLSVRSAPPAGGSGRCLRPTRRCTIACLASVPMGTAPSVQAMEE
jgi:hypothetical protein